MESVERRLVNSEPGTVLLFTPPFDRHDPHPGYIMGYPPGVRENGGQYTHAAIWVALAYARLGEGGKYGAPAVYSSEQKVKVGIFKDFAVDLKAPERAMFVWRVRLTQPLHPGPNSHRAPHRPTLVLRRVRHPAAKFSATSPGQPFTNTITGLRRFLRARTPSNF